MKDSHAHSVSFNVRRQLAIAAGLIIGVVSTVSGQTVAERHALTASDGRDDDRFGKVLAIDGAHLAVGAAFNDQRGPNTGSVYIYDVSAGVELATIRARDARAYDTLGSSVAIDGSFVAIGAMNADSDVAKSGTAYLYDWTSGQLLFKFEPEQPVPSGQFGNAIAIDDGVVAVGAHYYGLPSSVPGHVYLYDASTGSQTALLTPSDGANEDQFGWSVDIDDGVVAVGSIRDDDNGNNSGSVYLFDAVSGSQIAKLTASDGEAQDRFGWSVAIHNGIVAVGSYLDDDGGVNSGSVYLFDAATGNQILKILRPRGRANDWFGFHVSLDGNNLLVSSGKSGASLFDLTSLELTAQLIGTDSISDDRFGYVSAISGDIAVVGALFDDNRNGSDAGAVYVFDTRCPADLDRDGMVRLSDAMLFIAEYSSASPTADWNNDGIRNFFDLAAYIDDLSAGCPDH